MAKLPHVILDKKLFPFWDSITSPAFSFLEKLSALFEEKKDKGTIWLSHKRLTHDGDDKTMASTESPDSNEYQCLVRVTNGKNRFSTKIGSGELLKFQAHYGSLLKASMTTLRKRDKKQEKLRSEEAAKRKKKMSETITLDGPNRGNGRRTHQRKVKALLKQEESQKKFREREEARKRAERLL